MFVMENEQYPQRFTPQYLMLDQDLSKNLNKQPLHKHVIVAICVGILIYLIIYPIKPKRAIPLMTLITIIVALTELGK